MNGRKYTWHKIGEAASAKSQWQTGIGRVEINGKAVCITRFREEWFAFAGNCPHAGGPLEEGHVDAGGNVVCPLHDYKFSIKNGRNTSGEDYFLKTYPVEIRPDGFFIGIEEKNESGGC